MDEYGGRQIVGIDLHRRRSVIVRMTEAGERLGVARIDNDPVALSLERANLFGLLPEVSELPIEPVVGLIETTLLVLGTLA